MPVATILSFPVWYQLPRCQLPLGLGSRLITHPGTSSVTKGAGIHPNKMDTSEFAFLKNFNYLFLTVLGLWRRFSLVMASGGYSLVAVHGLLTEMLSLSQSTGFSSCSA